MAELLFFEDVPAARAVGTALRRASDTTQPSTAKDAGHPHPPDVCYAGQWRERSDTIAIRNEGLPILVKAGSRTELLKKFGRLSESSD